MSGIYTRSTRQRSKPVTLDLRKTEFGYELIDEKSTNPILNPRNVMPRPEKPLAYSKSLSSKSIEKGGTTPPSSIPQPTDALSRSKTMMKPPVMNTTNLSIQNGAPIMDRNPMSRPVDVTIKKELYPFSNLSMTPVRMGPAADTTTLNDLNISSQFERHAVPTFGHSLQEGLYPRPVDRPQKKYAISMPSAAQWFDIDKIHQIEKDFMPEFFLGKPTKTPELYKRYRNFIINLYRQNPANYLNATTCRKNLAGDACSIIRLHSFLEHWGLINFYIDPSNYPKSLLLNKSNYHAEKLSTLSNKELKMDLIEQAVRNSVKDTEVEPLIDQIKKLNKESKPVCDHCGKSCGLVWYQKKALDQNQAPNLEPEGDKAAQAPQTTNQEDNTKKQSKDKLLFFCSKCYEKGNIPNILSQEEFEKVDLYNLCPDTLKPQITNSWSQEETFKLLDLIQKYGDNWTEIQKSFPYKTKDEIIFHYIRLPAEKITSINFELGESRGHEDTLEERIADQVPTVFGDYSNPILQHVAVFRSLLTKYKEQKKAKKKETMEIIQEENAKNTKIEDRSDLEITKISDRAKEEAITVAGQGMASVTKVETGDPFQSDREFEIADIEKDDFMRKEEEIIDERRVDEKNKPVKTHEERIKQLANHLVELQIRKLDVKVEYLDDYEKLLMLERKQYDILQNSLIADRVDVAHKRIEVIKQYPVPTSFNEQPLPLFDPKDTGYFDFNNHGANFNTDDMLDLAMGEGFPKDAY